MPSPSCLVCREKDTVQCLTLKASARNIAYFRCSQCSLVFQDPNAGFQEQEIYNEDYIQKRSQAPGNLSIAGPRIKTAEHYYSWVDQYVTKGNLLEVGCSTGLALKVAQDMGWKVFGVEVNSKAADIAKDVLKADVVRVGNLNDTMFPDNYFSLITLFDVIEHIPHPVEFMSLLNNKMAPGSSILFVTPDVDTLSFKALKEKWPHLVEEHLLLFSRQSMERLLRETGFTLKEYGWAKKYISIDMLKTHAEQHPDALFYRPIGRLLGLLSSLFKSSFPFNIGEMYVLAEKTA